MKALNQIHANQELRAPEVAEIMGISESSVKRAWILAKAFLRREVERNG
jgi:DNA-directed RNA polymerase specialized sigma24 family protein